MIIVGLLAFAVFLALAILHIFWALGGTWGFKESLPQKTNGEHLFVPRKIESLIVGLFLAAFGLYESIKIGLVEIDLPEWLLNTGGIAVASIFFIRAVGDFKYVGMFKKVKSTEFGQRDTKYFTPLCLIISILVATTEWLLH